MVARNAVITASVLIACTTLCKAADPDLKSRIRGALFGALVSDALTLGSHYEYDEKPSPDSRPLEQLVRDPASGIHHRGRPTTW